MVEIETRANAIFELQHMTTQGQRSHYTFVVDKKASRRNQFGDVRLHRKQSNANGAKGSGDGPRPGNMLISVGKGKPVPCYELLVTGRRHLVSEVLALRIAPAPPKLEHIHLIFCSVVALLTPGSDLGTFDLLSILRDSKNGRAKAHMADRAHDDGAWLDPPGDDSDENDSAMDLFEEAVVVGSKFTIDDFVEKPTWQDESSVAVDAGRGVRSGNWLKVVQRVHAPTPRGVSHNMRKRQDEEQGRKSSGDEEELREPPSAAAAWVFDANSDGVEIHV